MHTKKLARTRRATRSREKIKEVGAYRLCVNRTPRHIYAQIVAPGGATTLVCASTVEPAVRTEVGFGGNVNAAQVVGRVLAERAKAKGLTRVAFDRSGYKYHGRVKALADAAREHGMEF